MMRNMRQIFALCFILMLLVAGCSSEVERYTKKYDKSDYGSLQAKQTQKGKMISFGTNHIDDNQHINNSVQFSKKISTALSSIAGVADARVFLTDKNAYVAVVLDNTGRGYAKSNKYITQDTSTDSNIAPNTITNNPFKNFISVNDNTQLTDPFKQTIADKVFELAPEVEEVHTSANIKFMFYMDEFAKVAWSNESIDTYLKQFNILVQHQFANGMIMPTSLNDYRNK
ncbi:YhcN/YlaJ family sporulation lipoprotein [Paenibacillus endoradicis]|uniref:YhcN/YlaJ family sporulation lipoprotein n=1 Tax=Paenibacillus endoradicis TaxID=2972487 RepID=UPI002158D246|nr:YhcN/YlaJ family sporulation lipoprotein [Paenibacillus endoradicis]MCR8657041.1 YhcN/YlaJ family sporulation lipoprotein [Paenibacillus endoradicis]